MSEIISTKEEIEQKAKQEETRILKELGNFFYNERANKNISVRALNKLSGVSIAVIADLENAKSMPRIETLIRLGLALGIETNSIFSVMLDSKPANITPEALVRQTLGQCGFSKGETREIMDYTKYIKFKQLSNDKESESN